MTYAGIGALFLLFAFYGVAFAFIGYIASPAVLSLTLRKSNVRSTEIGDGVDHEV